MSDNYVFNHVSHVDGETEPQEYPKGSIWKMHGSFYILVYVDGYTLVSLNDGNWWNVARDEPEDAVPDGARRVHGTIEIETS